MKLRNKKTGEIWTLTNRNEGTSAVLWVSNGSQTHVIESIEELANNFEDYEEPKEQYYIKENGDIGTCGAIEDDIPDEMFSEMKSIGNYFETEEEAEKAVEKLKAWKRLKDKGFKFKKYSPIHMSINYGLSDYYDEAEKDLDLLFGGEE